MTELQYRYMGVKPFEASNRSIFFGRDEDIEGLYSLILSEKQVVLFGKSGYGKSSLLNAGVLPRFQEEEEPEKRAVVIAARLGTYVMDQTRTPMGTALAKLQEKLPDAQLGDPGKYLEALYPDTQNRPIWYHFKRRQDKSPGGRFVVVFDQFEEFFTYPAVEQEQFKRELAELLYSDIPQHLRKNLSKLSGEEKSHLAQQMNVKAVFAIRADRMSWMESMTDLLPAILHKRYELKSLTPQQAREAIEAPAALNKSGFATEPFGFTDRAVQKILSELTSTLNKGVEAFQLQKLCQYLESLVEKKSIPDRNGDGRPDIDEPDLPDMSNLYESYYRRQLERLQPHLRRTAQVVLEEGLLAEDSVTGEGRRMSVDSRSLKNQFGVDEALLKALENAYLVRKEPNTVGGDSLELSHDTLVAPVLKMKKERIGAEELDKARERERLLQQEADKERARRRKANMLSATALVLFLLTTVFGVWAMKERVTSDYNKTVAEEERDKARNLLKKFKDAEAEKILPQVAKFLELSESSKAKGYTENYHAFRKRAIDLLEQYPENDTLQAKLRELKN